MIFKLRLGTLITATLLSGGLMAQELETEEQKVGYMIGLDIGGSLYAQRDDIDVDALVTALRDIFEGGTSKMSKEEAQQVREIYIAKRKAIVEIEQIAAQAGQKTIADQNGVIGAAFLAENLGKEGVMATASGLQYKVLTAGTGASPAATDTVEVHYRGTLLDGTEFDSSYKRGKTLSFQLNRVIAGWTEGLQLMNIGSKYEFYIKPDLGYGPGGSATIPPNSTLKFEVELVGIAGAE